MTHGLTAWIKWVKVKGGPRARAKAKVKGRARGEFASIAKSPDILPEIARLRQPAKGLPPRDKPKGAREANTGEGEARVKEAK